MDDTSAGKRWVRLLPVIFVSYSLAYLDRANFGFGAAGGMAEDLGITPAVNSLLGSLFFLGYFFFQIPGALYAAGRSARKLLFWSLLLWGFMASATGIATNIHLLMVIRFLLGVIESAVLPGMLVLMSRWFTRRERSRTNSFLLLGNPLTIIWMSVLSGYLIHGIGWRWMFILEGIPSVLWAFVWLAVVRDRPEEATWLSTQEASLLKEQLHREQSGIRPIRNYGVAFRSRNVILLCLQYALWSVGVYGLVIWLPSIIRSSPDMNIVSTGWLSAVPYVLAIVGLFLAAHFSDKTLRRKAFITPFLLMGSLAFYGSYLGADNFWLSFVLLSVAGGCMYAAYPSFFAMIPEILPSNVAPGAIALINSFGALGSFVGAYVVGLLNGYTGNPQASYLFMAGSLLLSALLTVMVNVETADKSKRDAV